MPLQIVRNDITRLEVDAIVNTTNPEMVGYSGVDLAVHSAAGEGLDRECEKLAPIPEGIAVATGGYDLPCKYIIHTCGPVWEGGDHGEKEQLESCYISCLLKADELKCGSVAFPLISSGTYGYPRDRVLQLAVGIITEFLFEHEMNVYLCVYDRNSYELSQKLFSDVKEYIDDNYVDNTEQYNYYEPPVTMPECSCEICADMRPADADEKRREASRRRPSGRKIKTESYSMCIAGERVPHGKKDDLFPLDMGFAEMLFHLIDERKMTDVECYKKANVSRKTFSKIKSVRTYRPSKQTALAFAVALELDLDETGALLRTLGFSLSHSILFDVIVEYFIKNRNYDIFEINTVLFDRDLPCLGEGF